MAVTRSRGIGEGLGSHDSLRQRNSSGARAESRFPIVSRIQRVFARSGSRDIAAPIRRRPFQTALLCLLVVALLCVPPLFANTAIGYVPPIAAAALLLGCGLYLAAVKRGISFEAGECDHSCTRGEKLRFPIVVSNRSFLPAPRIEVVFYVSDIYGESGRYQRSRLTLPPRSAKEFDLNIRFDHIGIAKVGIEQMLVFDPLGLFALTKDNRRLEEVAVVARTIDIDPIDLSDHSLKEAQKSIKMSINDGMDYSGVREYHWGDPMKSIHWKLSSKATADYFTRLYETPTMPGMATVIDFECSDDDSSRLMDVYDTLVEAALAAERLACSEGFETELLFVGAEGIRERLKGPLEGRQGDVMRRIPRMGQGDGESVLELLRDEVSSSSCQNNLVICTCNLTNPMIDTLAMARGRSLFPFLLYVDVEPSDNNRAEAYDESRTEALNRLRAARIPYSVVKHVAVGAVSDGVEVGTKSSRNEAMGAKGFFARRRVAEDGL